MTGVCRGPNGQNSPQHIRIVIIGTTLHGRITKSICRPLVSRLPFNLMCTVQKTARRHFAPA